MNRLLIQVIVLFIAATAASPGNCQRAPKPLKRGDAAPRFFLYDTTGKMVFLKEHCGKSKNPKKAIILDFFSTDCGPCKREMPHLARLYRKNKNKGLMLVIVGFRQRSEMLKPYFKKNRLQDLLVLTDIYGVVSKKYGVKSLPRTVVLDGDCKVRELYRGETKGFRKKLKSAVAGLMK